MPPIRRRRPAAAAHRPAVLPLEPRQLFAGDLVDPATLAQQETVVTAIPPVLANLTDASSQTVDLKNYVYDPYAPGTIATFEFNVGQIDVALSDQATPTSVNNFLTYVTQGTYDGTVIHRSAVLDGSNNGLGTGASLNIGSSPAGAKITIGTAVDTGMVAGVVRSLRAKSWTTDDDGSHLLSASAIESMVVPGTFGDVLEVSSTSGYAVTNLTVGGASAPWYVNGGINRAVVGKATDSFSINDGSLIHSLTVKGDLGSDMNVIAAAIDSVVVTGAMDGATIQTNGLVNKSVVQMRSVAVRGAMTNSIVYATGNIGTVSAASLSGSKVYAGVSTALAGTTTLPSSTTDLSAEVTIGRVVLPGGKATFVNSDIAAYHVGAVRLGTVTTDNSGTAFGLSGHTFASVVANLNGKQLLVLGPKQTQTAQVLSTYVTGKKIDLGDFVVTVY